MNDSRMPKITINKDDLGEICAMQQEKGYFILEKPLTAHWFKMFGSHIIASRFRRELGNMAMLVKGSELVFQCRIIYVNEAPVPDELKVKLKTDQMCVIKSKFSSLDMVNIFNFLKEL